MNLKTGTYEVDPDHVAYTGVIVGARADEEGSRSKERYFSPRDKNDDWDVGDQPPEFWNQFKTDFAPGTHVRIHPLLDWTELNIWEYIKRENIPTVSLYYDQGSGTRYRSLGCGPCQSPSKARRRTWTTSSPSSRAARCGTSPSARAACRTASTASKSFVEKATCDDVRQRSSVAVLPVVFFVRQRPHQ